MINFSQANFVKSTINKEDRPNELNSDILIVGRSNVGKSSLINALTNKKKLAFTSKKPGHTRLLNYYDIDHRFYLVDAPGYGYAQGGVDLDRLFNEMMESYFENNHYLKLVLVLLDARRTLNNDDQQILSYLKNNKIPYYLIVTKFDKVNQKEKALLHKHLKENGFNQEHIFYTSSLDNSSFLPLKKAIDNIL